MPSAAATVDNTTGGMGPIDSGVWPSSAPPSAAPPPQPPPVSQPIAASVTPPAAPQPPSAAPPDPMASFMRRLAQGESGGDPYALYGGGDFGFPQWSGRQGPAGKSHAAGALQFEPQTWQTAATAFQKATGVAPNFNNPKDQYAVGEFWAKSVYKQASGGRDLPTDLAQGSVQPDGWNALVKQWPSLEPHNLNAQWNQQTPEEKENVKQYQEQVQKIQSQLAPMMQQYAAQINKQPEGSAARQQLIAELQQNSAEMMKEWREKVMNPPAATPMENWHNVGSVGFILAALAGLFSRQHITAGLTAGAAALNAMAKNNNDEYNRQYKIWKDQTEMGAQMIQMNNSQIRDILADEKMAVDEKNARLQQLASELGLQTQLGSMSLNPIEYAGKYLQMTDKALAQMQLASSRLEEAAVLRGWNNIVQNQDGSYSEINSITNERRDLPAGSVPLKVAGSTGSPQDVEAAAQMISKYDMAPLSAWVLKTPYGQKVMTRVHELNPDYNASQFAARQSGARAFASGRQADAVRSISVSVDHLDVAEQLGLALGNHDNRAINAAKAALETQFGYTGPVDFNTAKSIVGDEVTKAVLGGMGTLSDRETLKQNFSVSSSPAQLLDVIHTLKRLMAGQLSGYRRQYEHATGESNFESLLSPRARQELESLGPSGSGSGGVPVPAAHTGDPDGTKYRGSDGRVYVKQGGFMVPQQ